MLVAQLEKAEQNVVPLRLQLLDAARSDLIVHTVDERLLHLRRPEAQHPKSSAIHTLPADCPIFASEGGQIADVSRGPRSANSGLIGGKSKQRRRHGNLHSSRRSKIALGSSVLERQISNLGTSANDSSASLRGGLHDMRSASRDAFDLLDDLNSGYASTFDAFFTAVLQESPSASL